jgi:mannose-6-phosphate isomerase-like protein (cupin superfamily)
MIKKGKIWGDTTEIFTKNNVSIHRICTKKDYCCSKHKHSFKHNLFYVESGKVKIQHWQQDYDLLDETILNQGEMTTVPPGHYHKFISLEDSIVYEIYYVELLENDIQREDCGKKL